MLDRYFIDPARPMVTQRVLDFQERAAFNQAQGRGRIFTREELERIRPRSAEALLGSIPTSRCDPQIRLDGRIVPKETRLTLTLPEIGAIQAQVASAEGDVIHAHFLEMADDVRATLARALDRWHSGDDALISTVQAAARQISGLLNDTIDSGGISADAMYSTAYLPIEGSDPQQYMMAYTELFDRLLPPIQEAVLQKEARIDFCATVDRNGYLPTHNLKYSQPQRPGDTAWNVANCRNRRIFDDFTGIAAARSRAPALVQTYRRDMGGGKFLLMKDVSAPILVHGRHWGALRLGCRPT